MDCPFSKARCWPLGYKLSSQKSDGCHQQLQQAGGCTQLDVAIPCHWHASSGQMLAAKTTSLHVINSPVSSVCHQSLLENSGQIFKYWSLLEQFKFPKYNYVIDFKVKRCFVHQNGSQERQFCVCDIQVQNNRLKFQAQLQLVEPLLKAVSHWPKVIHLFRLL